MSDKVGIGSESLYVLYFRDKTRTMPEKDVIKIRKEFTVVDTSRRSLLIRVRGDEYLMKFIKGISGDWQVLPHSTHERLSHDEDEETNEPRIRRTVFALASAARTTAPRD